MGVFARFLMAYGVGMRSEILCYLAIRGAVVWEVGMKMYARSDTSM
jgi:hypothetical protein